MASETDVRIARAVALKAAAGLVCARPGNVGTNNFLPFTRSLAEGVSDWLPQTDLADEPHRP